MVTKNVIIKNPAGLYLNFVGVLCKYAVEFKSTIELKKGNMIINAKSLLNVLGANIVYGDNIEIVCNGVDEEMALEKIYQILEKETL